MRWCLFESSAFCEGVPNMSIMDGLLAMKNPFGYGLFWFVRAEKVEQCKQSGNALSYCRKSGIRFASDAARLCLRI